MGTAVTLAPSKAPSADAELRRLGIGGSDVAALLGLSPYKTPLDLYLQKIGVWEDEHESEAARWGQIMEPILAREYVTRYGVSLIRREGSRGHPVWLYPHPDHTTEIDGEGYEGSSAHLLDTLIHPKYPWARGHVDAIGLAQYGVPRHVVEFKTADLRLEGHWGDEDSDQVPEAYLVQAQWYLMLTELELAEVAVLIGGNRFRRYILPRDQELIDLMLAQAAAFWERVEKRNPPDPDPGERGKQSLARMYPRALGREIPAPQAAVELAEQLYKLKIAEKEVEAARVEVENEIKAIMADAPRMILGPRSYIGWQNNRDSRVTDWEAVARDAGANPQLIARHTSTKPGPRVFRPQGLEKLFSSFA